MNPAPARVLVVEDDPFLGELVAGELRDAGFEVLSAGTGAEALDALASGAPDAVVLDLGLPDLPGQEVLARIREHWPYVQVVVLTASGDLETAVACTRAGASDYLAKPFDRPRLLTSVRNAAERGRLQREVEGLRNALRRTTGFGAFIGRSQAVRAPLELLRRAAKSEVTVLIEGESGTGKEVAARALHDESPRAGGPFVAINCGAIPESLVESHLFGHEKGSFTGATHDRAGCFEEASGGTLFLDEAGDLPPAVQVRLLRVLQERTVQRVGSSRQIPVDVRILAATNRDLRAQVAEGEFREDLYYRLAVFPVRLPPLRERGTDVVLLAHAFLDEEPGGPTGFTSYATRALLEHDWPGNVRELRNAIDRALVLEDSSMIRLSSLPPDLVAAVFPDGPPDADALEALERAAQESEPSSTGVERGADLEPDGLTTPGTVLTWDAYEQRIIAHALGTFDWRIKDTLAALQIGRATLYRKIERFGLERPSR